MLHLSGIFAYLGRLIKFFSAWGTETLGCGLLGRMSTQADTEYSLCYAITCMAACSTLLSLVVLVYPLVGLASPLAILFCPLAILFCPLAVLARPLVQYSLVHSQYLSVNSQYSQYYLLVILSLIHYFSNKIKEVFILNYSEIIENNYKLMIHVYNSL